MTMLTRLTAAALLVAALGVAPVLAADTKPTPTGTWQTVDGQARVRVTLCGDGTELCAKLMALNGEARTPGNLQLLNRYVVEQAEPGDANEWSGTLHYDGHTAPGHIVLVSANAITVSGCQMGLCKTLQVRRVGAARGSATVAGAAAQMLTASN
jgi:uncharacterized protein (DUF2147 family)